MIVSRACDGCQTRPGGRGADRDLRLTAKQPARKTFQPHHHPPSQSWPFPAPRHTSSALWSLCLDKVEPHNHIHSTMPHSTYSGVRQLRGLPAVGYLTSVMGKLVSHLLTVRDNGPWQSQDQVSQALTYIKCSINVNC